MPAKQHNSPEKPEKSAPLRGMWSGTISFGLVSVPVSLFPGLRSRPTHLRWMTSDGGPVRRRYMCPEDERPLDREELVRGYEWEDGSMIVVEDDELAALEPEKSRDIALQQFVDLAEIADFYFDRPYFLAPSGGSSKAYQLLAQVMEKHERAGVGTFVMRGKEYLVAIVAERGILMAETMRFHDEVRSADRVPVHSERTSADEPLSRIRDALSTISRDTVDMSDLHDRYAQRLEELVQEKRKDKEDVVDAETADEEEPEITVDLVAVFKERMRQAAGKEEDTAKVDDGLASLSKKQLYRKAKEADIAGRSSMSKDELVEALSA